ncbi:MAG: dihydroorotate dehydrogenase electron transfer subunit [Candidatus Omnitrophica bacterium]|nr:dihydroorotate dehydrogenase electron transfer subunit [Candidatus Omnitrophota bacterium]
MLQIRAKLIYNKNITGNFFHLTLRAPRISGKCLPGQFISVKVNGPNEPLLRRPFGIHKVKGSDMEVLYEVVGRGTEILSQRKAGEYLDLIGPLGNGFDLGAFSGSRASSSPVIVAGGMGVAPLLFLAQRLRGLRASSPKLRTEVLIGAKTASSILCEKEFKNLGCDVKIATDDGSRGFKGYVSGLLERGLNTGRRPPIVIYACGPRLMLKEISRISEKYNAPAQASLEEHMACGIGACLGCVVNTKKGFERVCKEGPVFRANEIIWG